MNKKAWVIILAVTSAVTVFALCTTWALRPNSSTAKYADQVFQEAKERQNSSIVSVSEPLKTNVEEMSSEDKLALKVADILSSDEVFIANISDSIKSDINSELDSWGNTYREDILKEVANEGEAYKSYIVDEVVARESDIIASLDSGLATSKSYTDQLFDDMKSYVDSSISSSVESAKAYIDDEIGKNVAIAEEYINNKAIDLTEYTDSSLKNSEGYFDSVLDSAKAYADELASQVKDYIDSRTTVTIESTPVVTTVDEQEEVVVVKEEKKPFVIEREATIPNGIATVVAHKGYANIIFPETTEKADIDYVFQTLSESYPLVDEIVSFFQSRNEVMAIYSQLLTESDILFGVNAVEEAIKALNTKPLIEPEIEPINEIEEPVDTNTTELEEVIVADTEAIDTPEEEKEPEEVIPTEEVMEVPVIEQDSYAFTLQLEIPLYDDVISVNAKKDSATFAIPRFVDDEIIYDALVMLIGEYPNETSAFDFSVDNKVVTVLFDRDYTESEVKGYLDFLIAFYSSRLDSFVPKAEIATEQRDEKPLIDIHREIPLLGEIAIVDATNGSAIISLPGFVTEEEIANGLAYLYSSYPAETANFDFAIENNRVDIIFDDIYTEDELNFFIDSAIYAIGEYIDSILNSIVKIHREVPLFNDVVVIDASNDSATIAFPQFVTDEDILLGLDYLKSYYPKEAEAFDFSIDGSLLKIAYDDIYTESELNNYIDSAIYLLSQYVDSLFVLAVPAIPDFEDVERKLIDIRVPAVPSFEQVERNLIEPRVPSSPSISVFPTAISIDPNPDVSEEEIPQIRDAIRDIEVERYLNLL